MRAAVWWSRAQSCSGGLDLRKYTAPYGKTGQVGGDLPSAASEEQAEHELRAIVIAFRTHLKIQLQPELNLPSGRACRSRAFRKTDCIALHALPAGPMQVSVGLLPPAGRRSAYS